MDSFGAPIMLTLPPYKMNFSSKNFLYYHPPPPPPKKKKKSNGKSFGACLKELIT